MNLTDDPSVLFAPTAGYTVKPVSAEVEGRSRKNESAILSGLQSYGQVHLAADLGVHETTVHDMKKRGEFQRLGKILAVLGLKVVPVGLKCMDMAQMEAIFTLAKARINSMDSASQLSFEDD